MNNNEKHEKAYTAYGPYGDESWEFYQQRLEMLAMIDAVCEECKDRDIGNYDPPFRKRDCWDCSVAEDRDKWSRSARKNQMPQYDYPVWNEAPEWE